jgi:uncharacterized damage-inducible protein DinB
MPTPGAAAMPMTSDPLEVLLAHNHWATRVVLNLCSGLSHEQFHRSFPIGPGQNGGLHATITHIISAMRRWVDRIGDRPLRPSLERLPPSAGQETDGRDRTPAELLALLDEATNELRELIPEVKDDPARLVTTRFGDQTYTFTRGAAFTHALTHGHYHRAQCLNMLRQLNVPGVSDKLPEIDVVDWQYDEESRS